MASERGKLLVIDGGDGAGKATQVSLLVKRLQDEGLKVETLDFPRYTQNTFGKLIRECLDGKRGDFLNLDPRIASTLFAADRFEAKPKIEEWLEEGKVVILDRYVSSNMIHQGAKVDDADALDSFLGWLDHMEHEIFNLPRPDIIIHLDVPFEVREKMKADAISNRKHGVEATDQYESNQDHQKAVEQRAKDIVSSYNNWYCINCTNEGAMRTREDIHEDIYQLLTDLPNT